MSHYRLNTKERKLGRECLPLCREHHTELHKTGQDTFVGKYHLQPVKIDKEIAKVYGLKGEN